MKTISYFLNKGQVNLAKDGPGGLEAVSNMTGKSEEEVLREANRAGAPARRAENLTIAKMGNMNAVPFQNAAQVNAAGMMGMQPTAVDPLGGMNQVVQGGIPGTGNVPGAQVPNPVAKLEDETKKDEPEKEVVYQGDAAKMVKNYGALPTSSRKDLAVKDFQTSGSILPEIEIKG